MCNRSSPESIERGSKPNTASRFHSDKTSARRCTTPPRLTSHQFPTRRCTQIAPSDGGHEVVAETIGTGTVSEQRERQVEMKQPGGQQPAESGISSGVGLDGDQADHRLADRGRSRNVVSTTALSGRTVACREAGAAGGAEAATAPLGATVTPVPAPAGGPMPVRTRVRRSPRHRPGGPRRHSMPRTAHDCAAWPRRCRRRRRKPRDRMRG